MNTVGYVFNTAGIISILVGTVIPLITAYFVKSTYSRDVKGLITLGLSTLSAFLTQLGVALAGNHAFDWKNIALSSLVTFVTAGLTYTQIWKNGALQVRLLNSGNTDLLK